MPADVIYAGAGLNTARAAVILVHGRGATAQSILELAPEIAPPGEERAAFLAPQAPGLSWYPYSLLAPIEQNEPHLSRSLQTLGEVLDQVQQAGIPPERTLLAGFSQGASLSLEYAARHPLRYGGLAGLSGGLIGPPGTVWGSGGSLDGTPVFLGCSDSDPYIPLARVREGEQVFKQLGARVTTRVYPGMGHTVNQDEIDFVRAMLSDLLQIP